MKRVPRFEEDLRLTLRELRVLLALWRYRDNKTGKAWPAQKKLAEDLEMDSRHVKRSLNHLVQLGWIEVTKDGRKNIYTLFQEPSHHEEIERPKAPSKPAQKHQEKQPEKGADLTLSFDNRGPNEPPHRGPNEPPTLIYTYMNYKNELNKTSLSGPDGAKNRTNYPDEFQALWDWYRGEVQWTPGKKSGAYRAYVKACKRFSHEEVQTALQHYLLELQHYGQRNQHLSTFLNDLDGIGDYQDAPELKGQPAEPQAPEEAAPVIDFAAYARRRQA
jgi:DNA-binding MarR family transcriptional regulator